MEIGALSLAGLGLPQFLQAEARGAVSRDTNVIFIWLPGGPPHMEMYDLKPDAPSEYRGIFRPIRTNVPGMEVGELLPRHAKCADKFNLIRSCHHEFADHGGGHKRFMTGRLPAAPTGFVNDAPAVTSVVVERLGGLNADGLPNVVVGTDTGRQGIDQALTALTEELYACGLDKNTLLICTGEFGSTPKLSQSRGTQTGVMQPGRDHWPTVYQHLGIDPHENTFDQLGRPMPILPFGSPIPEILPCV